MRKLALLGAVLAAGCASGPQGAGYRWVKDGAGPGEFHRQSGQCRASALSVPAPLARQVMIFESCLEGAGWYRAPN